MRVLISTVLFFLFQVVCCFGQEKEIENHFKNVKTSRLFMLGTFHFANPGLDSYKPKHTVDIFSEKRQKELDSLLMVIEHYAPTKIAVEWPAHRQSKLDSLYTAYLKGEFELKSNEVFQIGFRLAKRLKHTKIYAIDAPARGFKSGLTDEEHRKKKEAYIAAAGKEALARELALNKAYYSLYDHGDRLKASTSLLKYFRIMNHPAVVQNSHGHYLIGNFKMGNPEKKEYYGADQAIWWYSRNLRIFQNILRLHEPGKDKVFVLIGAGHLPILNFLARSSVDFRCTNLEAQIQR